MAALALPLIALTLVTVIEVRNALDDEHAVSDETQLARAATGPNGLFTNLQNERNRATVDLVGQGSLVELPCPDNASCRDETDTSLAQFEAVIAEQGGAAEEVYVPALTKLDELGQIRDEIDANAGPFTLEANSEVAADIFTRYTDIVGELLSSNRRLSSSIANEDLRRGTDLSYMSALQQDLLARLTRTLLLSIPHGGLTNEEVAAAGGLLAVANENFENIQLAAVDDYGPSAGRLVAAEENRGLLGRIAPAALETRQVDAGALLESVSAAEDGYLYTFREDVKELLDEQADSLEADAAQRRNVFLALAILVVAIAAAATWLVSRSITRPLRALTSQAADMANHRLPDAVQDILDTPLGEDVTMSEVAPITVKTNDEVSDVSGALNTVQDSALQLAVEQAVLRRNIADSFVNLGRRNQNLLSRQLDFITELEQNETDPEILGDLFRLDHLATRMRRNAESLLVLAGIDPPRQWAAPVRIQDVIRAALGEVEDFQRVTVRAVEPVTVLGSVAADLAHLVAELIENALVFSPQDQTVEVRGRVQSVEDGGSAYTLAIIDYGLGMRPDELDRANRRVAGTESFTVAPSKYLGHYVAGNLAARHDIVITLHNSPGNGSDQGGQSGGGITALVRLPALVLTAPAGGDSPTPEAEPPDLDPEPRELVGAGVGASSHTASGLARRTRTAAPAPQAFALPTEMIEALEQHTRHAPVASPSLPTPAAAPTAPPLPRRGDDPTDAPSSMPAGPAWPAPPEPPANPTWTVPAARAPGHTEPSELPTWPADEAPPLARRSPGGPAHPDDSTAAPTFPSRPAAPDDTTAGPSWPAPTDAPPPLARRQPSAPAEPDGSAAAPSWPAPTPAEALGWPAPAGAPADPGDSGSAPPWPAPAEPRSAPGEAPGWPAPAGPPTEGPSGTDSGERTASGLIRRRRGAQMPKTETVGLRRGTGESPAVPPAPKPPQQDSLQTLLGHFTAGVQRGLDETQEMDRPDDPPA